jgi:hypothetical protein
LPSAHTALCACAASLIACDSSCGGQSNGQLTNRLFETAVVLGELSQEDTLEYAMKRQPAQYGAEQLPAEQDPAGNWGSVTNGLQLSARFYTTNLVTGQPLTAVILVRNLGPREVTRGGGSSANYNYFLTLHRDGRLVAPLIPPLKSDHDGSAWHYDFPVGTQLRETLRLDKIFDLTQPGKYELFVEGGAFRAGSNTPIKARSGTATFRILPKEPAK